MTPHAQRLLDYLKGWRKDESWLDEHLPGWRERNEPVANVTYKENDDE